MAEERLIAAHKAETLGEAAVQLMLAISEVDLCLTSDLTDEEAHKASALIRGMLDSALAVVARDSGVDLAEFAGTHYLPDLARQIEDDEP